MIKGSIKSIALYYCYHQNDKALREKLDRHLAALKQQGQITTWHNGEIQAGTEWRREIAYQLQAADIILLLISSDFIAANDVYSGEMKQAFMRHERNEARVIPVLLRPVDMEGTAMSNLQALPGNGIPVISWPNRDEAFVDVARGIRLAVNTLMESRKLSEQGSSTITDEDAGVPNHEQARKEGIYQVVQPVFLFNSPLSDPRELFGRRRERTTLMDRLYKGSATSIVGPRRIGKTWLMQYIRLVIPIQFGSRFRIAYIDATSPRCATVSGFVATVLEEMDTFNAPLAQRSLDLVDMEQAVRNMKADGYIPVLCIDEFEGLTNEETFNLRFFTSLRAIAQAGLTLIISSKRPLIQLVSDTLKTSPFFNIFEKLTLRPFSVKEAETFVSAKSDLAKFNQQERDCLLRYGRIGEQGWPPARLQLIGALLLEEKLLSEQEDADDYRPEDPDYWHDFEQRLEEKYQEMGH